ncbi:hypothetical protein O3P69_017858 [Scylla paramamosain]|uniref:Gag-like protein n=1 Tax=Scylla paramamosain TaxID=85552 RepID=A0AAW0TG32_SCYPA
MGRVRIKHPRSKELGVRRKLLDLLAPGIKVTRLIPTHDAIIVLTPTDQDADAIFQDGLPARLAAEGFSALVPPELRAQRTIICFNLDDLVYENSPEDIAVEVRDQHTWAEAETVYKFPRSSTIKITFKSSDMAGKALREGIRLFHINIPGHQIRREYYVPLLTCNRCNAVEEHPTSSCPHPSDFVQCSECSSKEHSYRDCTANQKKCLHCGGEHSARAMRCPKRKKALKIKEEASRQNRGTASTSYARAAQSAGPPAGSTAPDPSQMLAGLIMFICRCWVYPSPPAAADD